MATCKGCGKDIVWGRDENNKRIPLDPKPPVYDVLAEGGQDVHVQRNYKAMVSHFVTCPKANDFSGSKKKAEATE